MTAVEGIRRLSFIASRLRDYNWQLGVKCYSQHMGIWNKADNVESFSPYKFDGWSTRRRFGYLEAL